MSQDHPHISAHQAPPSEVIQRVAEALATAEPSPTVASITRTSEGTASPLLPRRAS